VKIEELEEMDKAMGLLSSTIMMRRSPSLAKLIASPQKPQQPSVRRNEKEYRQSTRTLASAARLRAPSARILAPLIRLP
jgi:hypothetical protein